MERFEKFYMNELTSCQLEAIKFVAYKAAKVSEDYINACFGKYDAVFIAYHMDEIKSVQFLNIIENQLDTYYYFGCLFSLEAYHLKAFGRLLGDIINENMHQQVHKCKIRT